MAEKYRGGRRGRAAMGVASALFVSLAFCVCAPGLATGAEGPAGSCDARKSVGFCYEYVGAGWTAEKAKRECASASDGAFLEGGCPGEPTSGRCVYDLGGDEGRRIVYYFYKDGFSEKQARMSCPGTFTTD